MMALSNDLSILQRRDQILADLSEIGDVPATLVAVSKKQPDYLIDEALRTGQRIFGENRVQEAYARWRDRRKDYSDLELRLIGPLQSNKAEDAVALFDVIETIDRPKLVKALASAMDKTGCAPTYMIQVNTGQEPQKSGVAPHELAALYDLAINSGLKVMGLMCIPPIDEPAGPHFALLAKMATQLGLPHLSMGMSSDYQLAAQFGATHVRVGTAFFGSRES